MKFISSLKWLKLVRVWEGGPCGNWIPPKPEFKGLSCSRTVSLGFEYKGGLLRLWVIPRFQTAEGLSTDLKAVGI